MFAVLTETRYTMQTSRLAFHTRGSFDNGRPLMPTGVARIMEVA